jgi:hypothetical protein
MTDPLDDKIESKGNAFAALDRLYDENEECLHRLAMEEPQITAEQLQELCGDVNLEQLIRDKIVNEGKEKLDKDFEKILYDNLWDLYVTADPFDKLIEEIREKYRLSWEKSLEEFEKFCKFQDDDFKFAIEYGRFPPRITIEKIVVEAKPRKLRAEYSLEFLPDIASYNVDSFKELLFKMQEEENSKNYNYIIMHPDAYKSLMDYNNQNATQRFLQKIKWGFDDCRDNFRNWSGHMRGEEWDFWEILNGEATGYE